MEPTKQPIPSDERESDDLCQTRCFHPEAIATAREKALDGRIVERLAEFFKVFADPSRLSLLNALQSAELCVCDLSETLGMSQSAVSHQLRVLRAARLVKYRRQGKMAFYSLDDGHIAEILRAGLEHLREE